VFWHFQARGTGPAELARHLALVIAQRLVHRLCPDCAVPDASPELRAVLARAANSWLAGVPVQAKVARPGGCAACAGRGYRGRLLLAEVLDVDAGVRALAAEGFAGHDMERSLYAEGQSLWDQGIGLLAAGRTSLSALRSAMREPR
jgi:general secretion pathway protein E